MQVIGRAALALALAALPRLAHADDFRSCDGFDTPTAKVDGMSRDTLLFGLATATVDKRAGEVALGAAGVAACDRALADPALLPAYTLRRANLLQARALHAASDARYDLALASVDASDAAGNADPLFATSAGLANRAIRAYALTLTDRSAAARAEIDAIVAARPWSASIRKLAFTLRARIDEGQALAKLPDDLKLTPESASLLFWHAISTGDYPAALGYAPAISWDLPKKRGGWTFEGDELARNEAIVERANVAGAWALALAATGHPAEARSILDAAAQDVAEALAEPPPRGPNQPARKQDTQAWFARLPHARRAETELAQWRAGVQLLADIAGKAAEPAIAAYQASPAAKLPIVPAVLARIKLTAPGEAAERDAALAGYRAKLAEERRRAFGIPVAQLIPQLPRPLTAKMIPVLKPAGDGYFLSDTGLSRAREGTSDTWTVRFVHKYAPIQVCEEMALFGAATSALKEGKDGLLVLSRRSAALSTQLIGGYGASGTFASGYEAQLRVAYVDSAHLPPEFAAAPARVIPARAVVDDLSKRYRQTSGLTVAW